MKNMNIINKIANFFGEKFEKTADAGKTLCILLMIGEPKFDHDILMSDE
ncbi:MAG: hypothetical protein FWF78_10705 [Defluviitaleaceae bacterium]|nr:hypothetical protein [Defluviitaleaceae bacterium]